MYTEEVKRDIAEHDAWKVRMESQEAAKVQRKFSPARKFTVHFDLVETIFMVLLGLYGIGAVLLGVHIGNPDTSGSYYSTATDTQTATAWIVAAGGVISAAFGALMVDLVLRWMKYTLSALLSIEDGALDIKDNLYAKDETV
jgi:uncharacterized protein YceK